MSDFNPINTYSVKEFVKKMKITSLDLFKSKSGESMYCAEADAPHVPVCFVSTKIHSFNDVTKPVISEFKNDEGQPYYVLHNEGDGKKQSEGSLF